MFLSLYSNGYDTDNSDLWAILPGQLYQTKKNDWANPYNKEWVHLNNRNRSTQIRQYNRVNLRVV